MVGVISNYLNRTFKILQNWIDFHNEIKHIKQTLINNNYKISMVDQQNNNFINNHYTNNNNNNNETSIPI